MIGRTKLTALNASSRRDISNATARFWAGLGIGIAICSLSPFTLPFWACGIVGGIGLALLLSSRGEA